MMTLSDRVWLALAETTTYEVQTYNKENPTRTVTKRFVETLKAPSILILLAVARIEALGKAATSADLATMTGMSTSSARNHLGILIRTGWVRRGDDHSYRLNQAVL